MIRAEGNTITIGLQNREGIDGVTVDDAVAVLGAASRGYRLFRLFQLVETGFRLDQAADFPEANEWIGGLYIQHSSVGSFEAGLRAIGEGAGKGIGLAAEGVANGLVAIVTAPAEFRRRWARAREANAEARSREAEAAAQEARLTAFVWSGEVMRGERTATPEQFLYALEVQVQAGVISREFADRRVRELSNDVEAVSRIAEAGVLSP